MDFITKINIPPIPQEERLSYTSSVVSMGSCFAAHLEQKFAYYKLPYLKTPFGTLFHPLAIEKSLLRALEPNPFTEADFFTQDDLWVSFDLHSQWASSSLPTLIEKLNTSLESFSKALQEASVMAITLGTAWVYEHIATGNIVANCHKQPASIFKKRLLSIEEITASLSQSIAFLRRKNPSMKVILTVSPVRHLKDGATENLLSKSRLVCAIHELLGTTSENKAEKAFYFPSYELLMDELRDYRFYKEDMVHPSDQAVQYVWQRFVETFFTSEAQTLMQEVDSIQRSLAHRPFNPLSQKHLAFEENLAKKIKALQEKYPYLTF